MPETRRERSTQLHLLLHAGKNSTKKRGPDVPEAAPGESAVEGGGDQNTKLTPATGPLNSCFRPMVPSLPFLSASSLNQS